MTRDIHAFYATLAAICYLVTVGAALAAFGHNLEAIGVSAAVTGLIGVIRLPESKRVEIDQPADNPVPTTDAEDPLR